MMRFRFSSRMFGDQPGGDRRVRLGVGLGLLLLGAATVPVRTLAASQPVYRLDRSETVFVDDLEQRALRYFV